ncbi:ROK family transcriptional regulator [Halobacillus sp. Marseille-Q1614]|uniref:ROK family transcriptional regulator n=1 Tax=Halobacillus sp. Marseille-Q1614 TaxID=2709134 RepID=UPI00156ECE3F|nr:ROK family transcriptional regulator [Halobacillus sp. Marseille-Q1614]
MKRNGFKLMQELNQFRILDMIRKYGPISRSDLAKRLNLSPTTVATAVSEFIKEGMVVDGQPGHSRGGRKPILVSFVPDSRFLIGVSITNSAITLASMDMEANIIKKSICTINILEKEAIVDYIVSSIAAYVKEISDLDNCIGISTIAPGIVDSENGIIRKNTKLNLEEVPLKALVEERTGLKTWVDNDANAIVLAEKQFGTFQDKRNLVYIQLGEGLGAGMIINDEIFRGRNGGAGEFGHISLDKHGPVCECGNAGCLDYYVGWPAVYGKILSSLTRGKSSVMLKMAEGDLAGIDLPIFLKALASKDELAQEIAGEMASYLAAGLVTITHLLNPDVILIGWDAIYHDSSLMEAVQDELKEHSFVLFTDDLEVHPATLGQDFQLKGAAAVLLQDIFNFSI